MTNQDLDGAVLKIIKDGARRMAIIVEQVNKTFFLSEPTISSSTVDNSLRRLKAAGRIAYTRTDGWGVVPTKGAADGTTDGTTDGGVEP